jgi:NTE family protein
MQDNVQLSFVGKDDFLIQPDLTGLSFVDFGKIPEIMKRGEDAARALKKKLSRFSLSESDYNAWRASLPRRPQLPVVEGIEIKNGTRIADSVLKPFISQPVGAVLDPVRMQSDLARLYGLGYFDCIDYHVENRGKKKKVVVVEAPRKSWGPDYLKLGFKMAEDFKGHGDYGIMARYQRTELNSLGAELQVDGIVGLNSGVSAEFYQPVGKVPRHLSYGAPYFVFANALLQQNNQSILVNDGVELPFRDQHSALLGGGGRSLGNWGQFRLGMGLVKQNYHTPTVPESGRKYTQGEGAASLSMDTLDDASFPRKGFLGEVSGRATGKSLGGPAPASMASATALGAFSSERHTVRLKGHWADNFSGPSENSYLQRMGGFLNLGGYSQNSLIGTQKALVQTQYLYKVGALAGKPLYGGVAGEWGSVLNQAEEVNPNRSIFSGTVFAGLDTGIGPVYLAYSKAEGNAKSVYLYVGQSF